MSEEENPSGELIDRVSPVVMVESALSKRSVPFKPTELQDAEPPVSHQKCAPVVATVASGPENLKESPVIPVNKEQIESEYEVKSEKHKDVAKKLSSHILSSKRESTPAVEIAMAPIENESTKSNIITTLAPASSIVLPTSSIVAPIPDIDTDTDTDTKNEILEEKPNLDSITSEITELRSPEAAKKYKEWSDEEEAGGLSRSESRTSRATRVTRAVRELFCCGVQLEVPSEDNMSSPREGFFRSGI